MSGDNLEGKIEAEANNPAGNPIAFETAEEYVKRYDKESHFRKVVHAYLKIPSIQLFGLSMSKTFSPKGYARKKEQIVGRYREKMLQELQAAAEIEKLTKEAEIVRLQSERQAAELKEKREMHEQVAAANENVNTERIKVVEELNQTFEARKSEVIEKAKEERARILDRLDAEKFVATHIKETIIASPCIQKNEEGGLAFDENQLVSVLEERFLKEIVKGIEKSEGRGNFMANVMENYEGVVVKNDLINSPSEMRDVDWVESAILSRMRGYPYPVYPFLSVGVREGYGRTTVPVAVALDTSGSMNLKDRMTVARKTCLALDACMRQADKHNVTSLAVFNTDLKEVTPLELWKKITPEGYTSTHLALKWLIEKLDKMGPSIAYLITDGKPQMDDFKNPLELALKAAREFRYHPEIMLRIFLVDGDKETVGIIRKIGLEAGENTKVIPVENYQLADGAIKNVRQTLKEMIDIANF